MHITFYWGALVYIYGKRFIIESVLLPISVYVLQKLHFVFTSTTTSFLASSSIDLGVEVLIKLSDLQC